VREVAKEEGRGIGEKLLPSKKYVEKALISKETLGHFNQLD